MNHENFSMQSLSMFDTSLSVIIPTNPNKQDEIHKLEYQDHPIIIH